MYKKSIGQNEGNALVDEIKPNPEKNLNQKFHFSALSLVFDFK